MFVSKFERILLCIAFFPTIIYLSCHKTHLSPNGRDFKGALRDTNSLHCHHFFCSLFSCGNCLVLQNTISRPLNDQFRHSPQLCACYGLDVVRRNESFKD